MGGMTSSAFWLSPDVRPDFEKESTIDPHYGFTYSRKTRKMIATEEEMDNANIPPENRDYCAHVLIEYFGCRDQKYPLVYLCKPERDAYSHCEYEDYVLRMKEFEREKRLLQRAKKKRLAEDAA